eukprot:3040855-Lingulodinium_polyedra.AAC.1
MPHPFPSSPPAPTQAATSIAGVGSTRASGRVPLPHGSSAPADVPVVYCPSLIATFGRCGPLRPRL